MSKKQWMVLLMLFLTYLLLGASIFYHIESRLEIERVREATLERIEINALLHEHYVPSRKHGYQEFLDKLTQYCGKSVYNYTENDKDNLKWDFYNSFYFAYTVVSTIGYGNLAPTSMLGRILMIFYALVGIPMNGILLAQLGEFFGHTFVKAHQKYKSYKHGRTEYYPRKLTSLETRKVGLAAQIFAYLTPGFVMFIFFPAFLFSYYEDWSYDEAIYYAFVTLTTIGFGDYVAGQDNSRGSGVFFILYKAFLICWISFGLGYIVMIMTFIAQGMRSKKIIRLEHKLALNLKHTQSRIWNEFNKEINYFRRVFNELQLSKVKRVYVDECEYELPPAKLSRSNSFPNLRDLTYGEDPDDDAIAPLRPRRRANSEVVPAEVQVARVVSETDLQRIDKTATFAAHAMVQPAELLARLVNILGYMPPTSEDVVGDACNSNSTEHEPRRSRIEETKLDERGTIGEGNAATWTIGSDRIPRLSRVRSRATSEVRLHESNNEDRNQAEWTWSGPTASRNIQELMKARTSEAKGEASTKDRSRFSNFRTIALAKSVPRALLSSGPWKRRFSMSASQKTTSELPSNDASTPARTLNKDIKEGRERRDSSSTSTSRRHYYTHTGAPTENGNNLLEETSLADFLRALTLLHASVGTVGSWPPNGWPGTDDEYARQTKPRRKMGTACLVPPKLPSLFTLFSSSPAETQSNQTTVTHQSNGRLSLGVAENKLLAAASASGREGRRGSLAAFVGGGARKPRRFSLRPVATPTSPPTPPRNDSPFLSNSGRGSRRGDAAVNTDLKVANKGSFIFESPREPLIRMEGTPGISSPIVPPSSSARRYSLRPHPGQTGSTAVGLPTSKAIPRWKAGMLQRQIGQMKLRRRVRAFSLSDVYANDPGKSGDGLDLNTRAGNADSAKQLPDQPCPREAETSAIRFEDSASRIAEPSVRLHENEFTPSHSSSSVQYAFAAVGQNVAVGDEQQSERHAEPLMEVKIEDPVTDIFERYNIDVRKETSQEDNHDGLTELKIETPETK